MMDYKLYRNLPSAPPENPQVAYHLSVIQAKQRGLKNKEQMFKKKYEKYTKILNRLTTPLACLVLRGLATLNLEAASIPAGMYLYLDPYNESEGMYNRSNWCISFGVVTW